MPDERDSKGVEWKKLIVTSILSSVVSGLIFVWFLGGMSKQVEINTNRLDTHLGIYTPKAYDSDAAVKERVAVLETNAINTAALLVDLKKDNELQHQAILVQLNKLNNH